MSDTPDNTPSPAPATQSDDLNVPTTVSRAPATEDSPKPKLTLAPKPVTSAPFSAAQIAAAQKMPSAKFSSPIPPAAEDEESLSPVFTIIAGLAAAAAIAFAYLLFLKTK